MLALQAPMLLTLAAMLVAAMVTDVHARVIPNGLNAAIAILSLPWWLAADLTAAEMALQVAIAFGLLVVFGLCFAAGMMGGGDVKLIAALALWLPAGAIVTMLVWMAIGGGVLTLLMVIVHHLRKAPERIEIPYGVAIAGAALMVVANDILTSPAA